MIFHAWFCQTGDATPIAGKQQFQGIIDRCLAFTPGIAAEAFHCTTSQHQNDRYAGRSLRGWKRSGFYAKSMLFHMGSKDVFHFVYQSGFVFAFFASFSCFDPRYTLQAADAMDQVFQLVGILDAP